MMDFTKVPVPYMIQPVVEYVLRGVPLGDFLYELFTNDLKGTFQTADEANLAAIPKWLKFVYYEVPADCQGSPQKVAAWCAIGGLEGLRTKHQSSENETNVAD